MTRSTSSPHAYFVRFSLPSAWIDVANPCQVALEERRKAAREDLDSIVTHTLASWVGSVNSMSQSCYHTNGSSSDCCRKLLMAFFTNEEDIWNREEEDFVAHQYDYWMDPERQTRVFSQGTVVDSCQRTCGTGHSYTLSFWYNNSSAISQPRFPAPLFSPSTWQSPQAILKCRSRPE